MKKRFRKTAKIALVMVYLVIVAGAVVRMTGSGMGCPDWPKCFGYYVPPTHISELQFKPNHFYKKNVVIIVDETLKVAKSDFTSKDTLNLDHWDTYTKHDYAIFNPVQTWVEYVNRLIGALSGIPILIFTVMSFWLWREKKRYVILSLLTVFGMGFQAWLGKTVVDSNLAPFKITIHMAMAIVIVFLILYLLYISKPEKTHQKFNKRFNTVVTIAIVLTFIQIILGTQVRQYVDEQIKNVGYVKSLWLENPTLQFYVHRSLSILVLLINSWLFLRNRRLNLGHSKLNWIMLCIFAEISTGIAMFYFDFPVASQPIHIVIATILIGVQFYIRLESQKPSVITT
ncbi:COX15/CtaA family protein [Gaetbulibacter aestuarii]|uniref:COX15/CtaA family protein n=1 Tax=Gaetbulibacter aestuarii TaxID=1502358 RepID=A0ABW7MXT9_9FLAO